MRPFLVFLACLAFYFGILSIGALLADATNLEISGHINGSGLQLLNYSGEMLNVSINGTELNGTIFCIVGQA
jgi:hypothetical protein